MYVIYVMYNVNQRYPQATVAQRAQQPLSIVPMLDSTLSWTEQLMDATQAGRASAGVLVAALQESKNHLVDNFKVRVFTPTISQLLFYNWARATRLCKPADMQTSKNAKVQIVSRG